MQNISTDNADASTASQGKVANGRQLQVFKIYPLDSRPVAESQSWVSVVRVLSEVKKRILLRYGLHHRFISATTALRLLNAADRKDLSASLDPAFNMPQSNALVQARQDTVRDTVNRIIQQNIIKNLRQQHLSQQRPAMMVNSVQLTDTADSKAQTETPCEAHTQNAVYSIFDHHHVFYAGAESEIALETLLSSLHLQGVASIKVVGTERFRRLAWLHAAALGMHIEGYAHTEMDRQALFMRTDTSTHANIRPCYMPAKAFQKTVMKAITSKTPMMDLSAAEREYLLQRVRQNIVDSNQQYKAEATA